MIKIAIDAGHGFNTAGKRTPVLPDGSVIREHIANVGVASLLYDELARCKVFDLIRIGWNDNTATDDIDAALTKRQQLIKDNKCDIVISCHFNAAGNGKDFNDAQGVGVHIHSTYSGDSQALADALYTALLQGTPQRGRGVHKDAFAMVNCKTMNVKAAALVELAFMTNQYEATELMGVFAFWKECAREIAQGICNYCNIPYVAELPTSINAKSSKEDITWLQIQLTKCVKGYTIEVTGTYDAQTRIGVLLYWHQLKWNESMKDDGTSVGTATINALTQERKE